MSTSVTLSPVAVEQFFINGVPALAAQVFVYAAGTTTKITTYTESTGTTVQTNPILLNARGEPQNSSGASVGLWVVPGTAYKLVFCTAQDTDPPTDPIWTVDNLIAQTLTGATVSVANVAAMRALVGSSLANGTVVYLDGYTVSNDGGQGTFLITTTNPGTVDNGLVFQSSTSGFWFVRQWDGITAYPEWWTAPLVNTGTNALPALDACVLAAPVSQLKAGVYTITGTWKIQTNWRLIRGAFLPDASGIGTATEINLNSATADICQIGPNAQPTPNSPTGFLGFIYLEHLTFNRTTAPTPPSSGFGGPTGLRCQWLTSCHFTDIWCNQNTNGFYITGTIFCKFNDCHAFRNISGTTSTNDYYCGFLQDNSPNIGLDSGNASVYYDYCGATSGSTPAYTGMTNSYGIYTVDGFTDTYVFKFETSQMYWGAIFNGSAGTVQYGSEDLIVNNCVFDSCFKGGINIGATGDTNCQAVISNNYIAPVGGAAQTYGIIINTTSGAISLTANQIISNVATTGAVGIYIFMSAGVITKGNVITDVAAPIILSTGNNCHLSDMINVTAANLVIGLAGVVLLSSNRNVVDVSLKCSASGSYYTYGVDMEGASNGFNEIRMSGLDPAALGGTSANKLVSNGTQITSAGTFSTNNLAQGITG